MNTIYAKSLGLNAVLLHALVDVISAGRVHFNGTSERINGGRNDAHLASFYSRHFATAHIQPPVVVQSKRGGPYAS